jgi:hypothetical protein
MKGAKEVLKELLKDLKGEIGDITVVREGKIGKELLDYIPRIEKEIGHECSKGIEETVYFITRDGKIFQHEEPFISVKLSLGMGGEEEMTHGKPIKTYLPENLQFIVLVRRSFFDSIYVRPEDNYDMTRVYIYENG